ncbi:NUDIX domain-containing protein [Micromonospora vinacea]|uniref:NUDIX domain-containing protein n=1 Tax=Micromonospora vinacea TaxID=709878 RepID=UPI00344F9EE7
MINGSGVRHRGVAGVQLTRRVGAYGLLWDSGRVLVVRDGVEGEFPELWRLPGGAVEHAEDAKRAVVREVAEQAGLTVTVNRLLAVVADVATFPEDKVALHTDRLLFELGTPHGALPEGTPQGTRPESTPHGALPESTPQGARSESTPQGTRPESTPHGALPEGAPHDARTESTPHGSRYEGAPHGALREGTLHGALREGTPHGARPEGGLRGEAGGLVDRACWLSLAEVAELPLTPFTAEALGLPVTPLPPGAHRSRDPFPPPHPDRRLRFGAYGLVTDPAGRILLTQIAEGYPGAGLWHLPGGGTDHGEQPATGLLRELVEEGGQVGRVVELLGVNNLHNPAALGPEGRPLDWHGVRVIYRVLVDVPTDAVVTESAGGSTARAGWFTRAEAVDLPLSDIAAVAIGQSGR